MIRIIAALAENRVIGKNNDLPWDIPADLERFRKLTKNHPIIMGRKTYEAIVSRRGKPLPHRTNIVITSNPDYRVPAGVLLYKNLSEAIADFQDQEPYIIGGAKIFEEGLKYANQLVLTEIPKVISGDTYFPEFDKSQWQRSVEFACPDYCFVNYERIIKNP